MPGGGGGRHAAVESGSARYSDEDPARALPALLEALAALDRFRRPAGRREAPRAARGHPPCAGLWVEAVAAEPSAAPGSSVDDHRVGGQPLDGSAHAVPRGGVRRAERQGRDTPLRQQPAGNAKNLTVVASARRRRTASRTGSRAATGTASTRSATATLIGVPREPPGAVAWPSRSVRARKTLEVHGAGHAGWTDPVRGERTRELAVVPRSPSTSRPPVLIFPDRTRSGCARARAGTRAEGVRDGAAGRPARMARRAREHPGDVRGPRRGACAALHCCTRRTQADRRARRGPAHRRERGAGARPGGCGSPAHPAADAPSAGRREAGAGRRSPAGEAGRLRHGLGRRDPGDLRQMGFEVTLLSDDDLEDQTFWRFDAIVVGVRAYNTRPRLAERRSACWTT